ncbi:MAG: response regulator transcription factor [Fimbriimonadaceae bacterium]|nr:response regulator transcription factor [Fimbriimonadaceae bacterium]
MRISLFCLDPVVADGIACLLSRQESFTVVSCSGHLAALSAICEAQQPDLLIFTEEFDDPSSRKMVRSFRDKVKVSTMLLHAQSRQDVGPDYEFDIHQSRWAGPTALFDAIRGLASDVPAGVPTVAPNPVDPDIAHQLRRLSTRERETAHLISQGMPNKQIAEKLGLSEPTIKLYAGRLLRAFECRNRVELALKLRSGDPVHTQES